MSLNTIRFTCTQLEGTGKQGVLKPDQNGYYTQAIGALNVFNSANMWYTYEGAKNLFESSSPFIRRVKRGVLRGEVGHPKQLPGMTLDQYADRILTIDENNTCVHFGEIWLDFEAYKDQRGNPVVGIMSKFKPSGPKSDFLQKQIDNSRENVCFSIRSFTEDYYSKGIRNRDIKQIVTFDYVNEPGILYAEKYRSPSLESLEETMFTQTNIQKAIDRQTLRLAFGQESSVLSKEDLFESFGWKTKQEPGYMKW